jgi:hypothetical protein
MVAELPDRSVNPSRRTQRTGESGVLELLGSKWEGEKFSAEFKRDGEVILGGWFAERIGTWRQNENRIEMTLPSDGFGKARILGIGILKGEKMGVKFKVQSLFGGQTVTSAMQIR